MAQSWWQKLFGQGSAPATTPVPAPEPAAEPEHALTPFDDEARAEVTEWVRDRVAAGYEDSDEIATGAVEVYEEEYDPEALARAVPGILSDALAAHRAEAAHWPAITDYDRLDAAFLALEAEGLIARQNFTCCGTCGAHEIWDEIHQAQDEGRPATGYAFFHMQDTESAVGGHGLYLNYGSCTEGEDAALDVARTVVTRLEAHGLHPEWDGTYNMRIHVPLDWKRRR